ncbi:MAG TPA: amidohydrolase family protein [Polyangiaceae bacterium]|jgi:hypothetical protein
MRRPLLGLASILVLTACGAEPPPQSEGPPPALTPPPVVTAPPPPVAAPVTVKRVVVSLTRPSGSDVTTTTADGTVTVAFDVMWNGRGPHADATIHVAPDGTIASLEAHGHHMMKAPVDEAFSIEGGHAHWKSHEETGDATVRRSAFFVPIADIPDALGLLAQALLKAPGGTLPLLPDGEAHIEKTGEATVLAHGQTRHVTEYDITGLDLTPTPVWMDDDGSWFGNISSFFSVVPEGWESAIEPLVEAQRKLSRERDRHVAEQLAHRPPPAGIAFTHARVLDVERGAWLADRTVVVVGDTIAAVGPSKTTKPPAGAEVVDLAGKALVPGLWDMHAHLSDSDGALNIGSGVTTVRDVGNDPDQLDDYKKRFDEGVAVGPHVFRAGFIEGRGEKAASSKVTAETEAEAKAGVELYAKRGYEMIKIYNSVKPELVPIITKEAHARGMTVTGHIPVHMLANEAVRDGYDGIEHVNQVLLNFFADHDTDTRTPTRFTLVGEKAADFDYASKPARDFFAYLRKHHTVIDPTVATFEGLYTAEQGKVPPGQQWISERLPIQTQRQFLTGGLPLEGKKELYGRSFEKMTQFSKALRDAGVTVVAGTDGIGGLLLDRELELFVKGGLTPAEALRDATLVPARAMGVEKKTGSIAPGKAADLAVIDGDPLANIADIRRAVTTVRGGVVFPAKETLASVGVRPWK